ncbi:M23 family metallopeptidase [Cohnella lupini]|uniref:Peptidase M23-like protein n=1 Tax=Cohnella lupini TaxID=1294267 RepID=A0A3D9HTR6_9BACL|nr:M23 family metallopeptidase [Cohnella lupini]RED52810.1 peptidase M23-like protein [Cohnella lupini]
MQRVVTLILLLTLLLWLQPLAYAEDASVLLGKYGMATTDPEIEGEKLDLLEEEYRVVSYKVNTNTMLSSAYDLHDQYYASRLASMDSEIYALADELTSISVQMGDSKEEEVPYILELDSKYRAVSDQLDLRRQARNGWMESQKEAVEAPPLSQSTQDIVKLNAISDRLDKQKAKVQLARSYPDLGDISSFSSPLAIPVQMTSPFGMRLDPLTREAMTFHKGMDMSAPIGTHVLAAFNGYVEEASENSELGTYVIVNHGHGIQTLYGHLSSYRVVQGQTVKQYEQIAESGNSGSRTTGPHLHFGVFIGGQALDPGIIVPHS